MRNSLKNKGFFIINLLGFTLGLCISLLIFLYIANELRYDKYHEKSERIYRLCIKASIGDTKFEQAFSSAQVLREMMTRYPEIEDAVKTISLQDINIRVDDKVYYEDLFVLADSSLFTIFTLPMVNGNPNTALAGPNAIVLSETTARKYFGSNDCLGEVMEIDAPYLGETAYTVSGIIKDMPEHSHFHFDYVVSSTTFPFLLENTGWSANNFVSYLLLGEGVSYKKLEEKFVQYVYDSFGGEEVYKSRVAQGDYWEFFLQPLESIHLHSDINGEWETNGNIIYIYIFSSVALFVLIIACINFINLSIAKSTLRAREVGIRKASGSSRKKLIFQFLGESAMLTFFSLVLSLVIIKVILPYYNDWLDRSISLNLFSDIRIFTGILLGWLIISLLTGLYPAFFLSSYTPVRVLKAKTVSESRGLGLRNLLVIIQFVASIFLIIGTIVISREMKLLKDGSLGFDKSDIIVVRTPPSFENKKQTIINELARNSSVQSISCSSGIPGEGFSNIGFRAEGIDKSFTLNLLSVDAGYDDVLRLKMTDGRFFSPGRLTDSTAVILNETAVKVIDLEDPIGKYVTDGGPNSVNFEIIGVVSDYHYESKHMKLRPMGLFFQGGPISRSQRFMSVRYQPGAESQVLAVTEDLWNEFMPGIPFRHSFLSEDYDSLYHNEQQTQQVFTLLSVLAIFVACLGLFGLASFIAQQRKGEVAIRKVMGASISQLIALLSRKYVRWLAIAFVIACPLAYYIMSQWLNNFAYKVVIGPSIYIIAGIITLVLALLTVSGITNRAANSNPAVVLRNE